MPEIHRNPEISDTEKPKYQLSKKSSQKRT